MKNLYVQKSKGYCTVFCFANLFRKDLSHFMTDEFKGCDDAAENKIASSIEDGLGVANVVSIRHSYNIPLPKDLIFKLLSFNEPPLKSHEEFDLIPYLLSVRIVNSHESWHSVVVVNKNGNLYYSDPYNDSFIKVDEHTLFTHFIDCWEVKRLTVNETQFARLSSKAIGLDLQ